MSAIFATAKVKHFKLLSNQVNAKVQQVIWGFLIQSQKCILLLDTC